ncbi:MAG: hypothetical protein IKU10_06490, partial [Clostridia bacterium]|nr:hypothetical protein [Clostridia bacterium]
MKITKRLLAILLALAVVATGMVGLFTSQAAAAFTSWTDVEQSIYHLGLEGVGVWDGNYEHYRYFAQEFVPAETNLSGAKLAMNLTAGTATVHLELRSNVNGTALAAANTNITSKGNGVNWYDVTLGQNVTVTPGNVYYLVYWLTARTASSLCIVHGKSVSNPDHPAYVWQMSSGGDVNFTKTGIVAGFELVTSNYVAPELPPTPDDPSAFIKWTEEGAGVTHLGLSTATSSDGNWTNYRYIGQEFVPAETDLYGAKVALNLTQGNATVHFEIREQVNGAALAENDVKITSKGDGRNWYELPLKQKLTVTQGKPYYLVYWLTARDPAAVCIVYASDVGAGGATHPGYFWRMADGGNVNFDPGVKYLIMCFETVYTRMSEPTNEEIAQPVIDLLSALPDPETITLADEAKVVAAREAYDALTDAQKALVPGYSVLVICEEKIAELKAAAEQEAANKAAAQVVIDQIAALKRGDSQAIAAAREAYDALTDAQKALVTNLAWLEELEIPVFEGMYGDVDGNEKSDATDALDVLKSVVGKIVFTNEQNEAGDVNDDGKVNAEDALMILKKVVGKIERYPAEENHPYFYLEQAEALDARIEAIGEITEDNYKEKTNDIETARALYDEMPEEGKALVTKLPVLEAAEKKWAEFKAIDDAKVPQPEDPANPVIAKGYQAIPQLQNVSGYATPVAPITSELAFNTLTQINQSYSKLYDLDIDCILAYEYGMPGDSNGGLAESWVENKHTYNDNATIGMMIAVNRDNSEYLEKYAGNRGVAD